MGASLRTAYEAYDGSYEEAAKPPGFQHDPLIKIPDYHDRLFTVIDARASEDDWESDSLMFENPL